MKHDTRQRPEHIRFWEKVNKLGREDCWEWTAGTARGYGIFNYSRKDWKRTKAKSISAHRWSYLNCVGPIPDGMLIDHICHNPLCVNPQHLRLASRKQNAENHNGNARSDSATGIRGVVKHGPGFRATVRHNGKEHRSTVFPTVEQAAEVAREMRNKFFSHNDRDRIPQRDADA